MKNEKATRKEIIDKKLELAGWNVADRMQVVEEYVINVPTYGEVAEPVSPYAGHQYSDYVLLGRDGKPLAVVEAKKTSVDPGIGQEQAKQYCHNIQNNTSGDLPFCFYTNGHDIYFWDIGNHPPRKVQGFPTRDDLERHRYLRSSRKPLAGELINTKIAGRDFQIMAIRAIMEAMERKRTRFLLVMATGTGKTRTCIAFVDALMRAGWAERVLFLVDRIALRDQTLDAFKEYLPNEPRWPKAGEKEIARDRRIYVSTYPTMLHIIRQDRPMLSPHFFDLVVVDESHRSIYNTYQEILDYFKVTTLGLTATPTDVIDHNTFRLFECEDGVPTFAFSYESAIKHVPPYLNGFQVMKIKTRFQEEGISKRTISLEDQKQLIIEGKEVAEINFEGTELEKKVINKGTNALIVREFMESCLKDADGVLPGKTIFFCMSIGHARRIHDIFNALYPEYHGELAKVLVSEDPRVHGKNGLLDQFTNKSMPRIAISVDMLDTGVDVREITNLVFAKPVFSYTKFWQMIGRGTRLLEKDKLKPWCLHKDHFLIMDCWDNFEYFKLNPLGRQPNPQIPLPVRLFNLRLDKIECAAERMEDAIAAKETAKLREQIGTLPQNSIVIKDAAADLQRLQDENFWLRLGAEKITFLRSTIAPLFRTVADADFKAMRFEKDMVETSLALLADEKDKYNALADGMMELVGELPLSVNIVSREEALIRQAQTRHFWATADDSRFDELISRLGPLMKYRQPDEVPTAPAKFNLKDILHSKEFIEFGPQHEALSTARYRELVEERIQELVLVSPILQKIRDNQPITDAEVTQLAAELHDERPHITLELLRRVYDNRKAAFIQFMRHILGIEALGSFTETVSQAFDTFIAAHSYMSERQMQFINLLRSYVLEKGEIHKRNLIEAPFTQVHPDGIRGVFSTNEIDEILALTANLV